MEQKTTEELLERRTQIALDSEVEGADLGALEAEVRSINAELETRQKAEAQRREIRKAVADGDGETIKNLKEKTMDIKEIRSSKEYLNAWAKGIMSGRYDECRKLLTSNALEANIGETDGIVPVPTYVEDRIQGIFERNDLLRRIRRTYFRGNLRVGFEVSSTGATVHAEGAEAIGDEELIIGVVEIIASMIKKTILVTDELVDMGGQAMLDYLFDEFENKIESYLANGVVLAIAAAPAVSDETVVGIPVHNVTVVTLDMVAQALALCEGTLTNPCLVMNRGTYAAIRAAQLAANYAVDPFEGLPILYNSTLPAFDDAQEEDPVVIVGDLDAVTANFPAGDQVRFIYDPYTNAPADLVRITGRLYVGIGVTTPGKLAKIVIGEGGNPKE